MDILLCHGKDRKLKVTIEDITKEDIVEIIQAVKNNSNLKSAKDIFWPDKDIFLPESSRIIIYGIGNDTQS